MNTISSHEIKSTAERAWNEGYLGSARLPVQFEYRMSRAETARIREAFRPGLAAEIDKLRAMPKRELNKMFTAPWVRITARLENESAGSEFYIEDYCPCRYVRGRQIRDFMSVEDVLNSRKVFSIWYPRGGDWHDTESYASLTPNESGTYDRVLKKVVSQEQAQRTARGFNRAKSKADFVRRVKEFVAEQNGLGWNLVAAVAKTKWGREKPTLVFTRTVSEPATTAPVVRPKIECVCESVPLDISDIIGGQAFSAEPPSPEPVSARPAEAEPEQRDIARIEKIVESSLGDRSSAEAKARAMNAKITDESKRARRAAACVRLGYDWLAECFAA